MKKSFIVTIFILMFTLEFYNHVFALEPNLKFSMSCEQSSICKNEEVSVILAVKTEAATNISTFKVTLNFDKDKLLFKDASSISPVKESELKTNKRDSSVDIIFLTEDEGINLEANQKVSLIEFNFKALASTHDESAFIRAEVSGAGSYDEKYLDLSSPCDTFIKIEDIKRFDCRLKSLSTVYGKISPSFDPDTYDYEVNVESDLKEIDFNSVPINYDAYIKTSPKKLKKAGDETLVKITVYSPDKKSKCVYRVKVKREPKENVSCEKSCEKNYKAKSAQNKKAKEHENLSVPKGTSSKTDLDFIENNPDSKTMVLRENGFDFLIFGGIVLAVIVILIIVWHGGKMSNNFNDEQKNV